jgi:hypothetical protein
MNKAKKRYISVLFVIVFCVSGTSILYQKHNTQTTTSVQHFKSQQEQRPKTLVKDLRDLELEYAQKRSQIYTRYNSQLKRATDIITEWTNQQQKIEQAESVAALQAMLIQAKTGLPTTKPVDNVHLIMQQSLQKDAQRLRKQSDRLQELLIRL